MDSDDTRLRAALRRSLEIVGDAAEPAPAFDELGAPAGPGGDERFHRSRRGLAIAGALVATVALVGGLLVVRSETDDGTRIGGVDTIPAAPATTGAPATVPDPTVATTIGSTVPPSTVSPTTVPPTTVQPTAEAGSLLTVEEVRTKQAEALRELPGFTATVTKSVVDPVSGEPSEETAQVSLLADGSVWVDRGVHSWGSYDPATHIVGGAFALPDGTTGYQEIVGQSDGSLPLSILVGHDPTQLVQALPDDPAGGFSTDVIETTFEGRPAWEITAVQTFDEPCFDPCSPGAPAAKIEQTEVRTIDQETGIVIRRSMTSTEANQQPQLSVLRDIRVADSMPAEFPGTFPDDAVVDRSGDPNAIATSGLAGVQALADTIGVAIPMPAGSDGMAISTRQNDGTFGAPDGTNIPGRFYTVETSSSEGFLSTASVRLMFSAPVDDGPVPVGETVVDGLFCRSLTDDGVCDDTGFVSPVAGTVIESGALAGHVVVLGSPDGPYGSITVGPFEIGITAPDAASVLAIANRFEMVQPS